MLRAGCRSVVMSLSLACGAWAAASEPLSAWGQAMLGVPPYADILAVPCPLPPTLQDVQQLSPQEFVRRQNALKRVLLARGVRSLAERKRMTDANMLASADMADKLGAPPQLALYLRLLASDTIGNRQRYMVQSALDSLLRAYLVDELAIRYFIEFSSLTEKELGEVLPWLPIESCFNMTPVVRDVNRMASDYILLRDIYVRVQSQYASVHDRESADAAAELACEMLVLHDTTTYTRLFAPDEMKQQMSLQISDLLVKPVLALQQERARLREHDYFGSLRLRLLDLLLG